MSDIEPICVEVAYALPNKQKIIRVLVEPGTSAYDAVKQSKMTAHFPDLDIDQATLGIFGQVLGSKGTRGPREHVLKAGDRVEIYRALIADPKEARRRRAASTQ